MGMLADMIEWIGIQPILGELQYFLNCRIPGLSTSHACFKIVENVHVCRVVGVAGENGDLSVREISGDSDQCHSCGKIGKMGLVGWSAALVIEVGGIWKWRHVCGNHYMTKTT